MKSDKTLALVYCAMAALMPPVVALVAIDWAVGLATGTLLAIPSAWLGWAAAQRAYRAQQTAERIPEEFRDLLDDVLPLWSKHIGLARMQSAEAVDGLAVQFATINTQLNEAVTLSTDSGGGSVVSSVQRAQSELPRVFDALGATRASREQLLSELEAMTRFVEQLSGMANDVGKLAAQTNLLSLNAAIEAARAGDAGRCFAVVADQVRELSNLSAKTGANITEKVGAINRTISVLVESARQSGQNEQKHLDDAQSVVQRVLAEFSSGVAGLAQRLELLQAHGRRVEQTVNSVLVELQFQDRVSQILGHVQDDAERLRQSVLIDKIPDRNSWLKTLEASYSTSEQIDIHQARDAQKKTPSPNEGVTFF